MTTQIFTTDSGGSGYPTRTAVIGWAVLLIVGILVVWAMLSVHWTHTLSIVVSGGVVLGLVSGALGSFAVLRQQSLLGDALAHTALPGIAIAFLLSGRELPALLLGAGIAGCIGVLLIRAITHTTRLKQDAAMAIVLSSFFAFGLALLAYIQGRGDASQAGLKSFVFGQAAAIVERDVWVLTLVASIVLVVMVVFWKEFKIITFDSEYAKTLGIRARMIDLLLSLLIVIAIVLGLQLAGVVLMVGMLIAPAVAAHGAYGAAGGIVRRGCWGDGGSHQWSGSRAAHRSSDRCGSGANRLDGAVHCSGAWHPVGVAGTAARSPCVCGAECVAGLISPLSQP
jgi:ABC-type Mn2+/Zn2+ transport system permease subunit